MTPYAGLRHVDELRQVVGPAADPGAVGSGERAGGEPVEDDG